MDATKDGEKALLFPTLRSWVVILLALALIVWISIDTFTGVNFLQSEKYMLFQFWVCVAFMADFFTDVYCARGRRWNYIGKHIFFFLLSIPYLNLVDYYDVRLSSQAMFYLRFVPLARGALAMSIVASYISHNRVTSIFASYVVILASVIYFSSLLFLYREHGLNPSVTDYGQALWWCFMESTTIGAPFSPMTVMGKVLAVALSGTGIIMYPLFTVYITSLVMRSKRVQTGTKK